MKKILLLLAITFCLNGKAQMCFNPATSYSAGDFPSWVASADFNGDGKADLAITLYDVNKVKIFMGVGNGNFVVSDSFVVGASPISVISSDFNGDGKADLATANRGTDDVSVLLGTGTGSFSTAVSYAVGSEPFFLINADFNNDGKVDLAVANTNSYNISVLLGTGTGSFSTATTFTAGYDPYSVASADFNGDGNADLAVANNFTNGTVSVLLGTGTGSFGTVTTFTTDTNSAFVISADFNGDSKADLAVINAFSNNVSILLGTGTGSFSTATNFSVGIDPFSVSSADFNNDGKLDLAVVNNDNSNNISILLGTGTGSFNAASIFTSGDDPVSAVSADFNGDGKLDLVTANNSSDDISVLLNCVATPTCVATVTDSLFNISPLNWDVLVHYSSQVANATWHWGDGTSTNGLYPSHTYSVSGNYNICVTGYASCGDSSTSCQNDSIYRLAHNTTNTSMIQVNVVSSTTGTSQISNIPSQITIYPNPTNGNFTIETNTTTKQTLQMYDINGKVVLTQTIQPTPNPSKEGNSTTIDASRLTDGVYNLSVISNEGVVNKRLVIVR